MVTMATNLNGTQAYRFELFEPQQAMPAPKKREVPVGPQRVIKAPEKTKEEKQAEAKEINRRIAVILSVAVVQFIEFPDAFVLMAEDLDNLLTLHHLFDITIDNTKVGLLLQEIFSA